MSRGRAAQAEGKGKTRAKGADVEGEPVVRRGRKTAEVRGSGGRKRVALSAGCHSAGEKPSRMISGGMRIVFQKSLLMGTENGFGEAVTTILFSRM